MSDNNNLPYNIDYKVKRTWVYIKLFTRIDIPKKNHDERIGLS